MTTLAPVGRCGNASATGDSGSLPNGRGQFVNCPYHFPATGARISLQGFLLIRQAVPFQVPVHNQGTFASACVTITSIVGKIGEGCLRGKFMRRSLPDGALVLHEGVESFWSD